MSGLFFCCPQSRDTALESTSLKMPFSRSVHFMSRGHVLLSCSRDSRNSHRYTVWPRFKRQLSIAHTEKPVPPSPGLISSKRGLIITCRSEGTRHGEQTLAVQIAECITSKSTFTNQLLLLPLIKLTVCPPSNIAGHPNYKQKTLRSPQPSRIKGSHESLLPCNG